MDELNALDEGIASATDDRQEKADVDRWTKRIKAARDYDEVARKQYAKDRRYARGDSGFDVTANLHGTYIDITESFLYAKDPDVDVLPSRALEPPDQDSVREAVESSLAPVQQNPMLSMIAGPMDPMMQQALQEAAVTEQVEKTMGQYRKRQRDAKYFAETTELVIYRCWEDADIKRKARRFVRSALTVGVGVLKASWQERRGYDPQALTAIRDLQDNIKRVRRLREELSDYSTGDTELEAKQAEFERQLQALQSQSERVLARGFVIDFDTPENLQFAPGYEIGRYLDMPWIAHRIPMRKEDAQDEYGLSAEDIKGATLYQARKPDCGIDESPSRVHDISAKEADSFVEQGEGETGEWVMGWEIWDRESNTVLTSIEGIKKWVREPWNPCATTRFYPFFVLLLNEVDGRRHPQSLVERSARLVDEYNRIGSAEAEHRRRVSPKTMFNEGRIDPTNARKLAAGGTQEMVGINPTNPQDTLEGLVMPVTYAQLDPMLYDRSRIVAELERIWGIQEALSGAVSVAKTATEAEIQQGGFQARSSGRRDLLEDVLSELAQYTAEVARHYMTTEDVTEIVGPDAFWPPYEGANDLRRFVTVEIRAGSTGKPNTSAEREAWSTLLPLLSGAIDKLGMLRNSTPTDVADCHERLLRITAERMGDRLDVDSLVPQPGPPQIAPADPATGQPVAPDGAPPPEVPAPTQEIA